MGSHLGDQRLDGGVERSGERKRNDSSDFDAATIAVALIWYGLERLFNRPNIRRGTPEKGYR